MAGSTPQETMAHAPTRSTGAGRSKATPPRATAAAPPYSAATRPLADRSRAFEPRPRVTGGPPPASLPLVGRDRGGGEPKAPSPPPPTPVPSPQGGGRPAGKLPQQPPFQSSPLPSIPAPPTAPSFPPPCGEGLRVGVSPKRRTLGHRTPIPSPQGGGRPAGAIPDPPTIFPGFTPGPIAPIHPSGALHGPRLSPGKFGAGEHERKTCPALTPSRTILPFPPPCGEGSRVG